MVDIGGDSIQDGTRASIRVLRFEKVYIKHKLSTRKQGSLEQKHRQNFCRQGSQKTKTTPQLSNATAKSSIADEGYFKPESDAGLKIKPKTFWHPLWCIRQRKNILFPTAYTHLITLSAFIWLWPAVNITQSYHAAKGVVRYVKKTEIREKSNGFIFLAKIPNFAEPKNVFSIGNLLYGSTITIVVQSFDAIQEHLTCIPVHSCYITTKLSDKVSKKVILFFSTKKWQKDFSPQTINHLTKLFNGNISQTCTNMT